jgi:hypothetical protein
MKRLLYLGYAALTLATAGAVLAEGNQGVGVNATVGPYCELTTLLDSTEVISAPFFPGEHNLGNLGYTCNFDTFNATLKIHAPSGTVLVNQSDGNRVQYDIKWDVPPVPDYQTSPFGHTATFTFDGAPGSPPNTEQVGPVLIKLHGDLTHAGTYSDVVTFSITP